MSDIRDMVNTAISEAVGDFMGTGPMALAQATLFIHGGDVHAAYDDLQMICCLDMPMQAAQDRAIKIINEKLSED